MTTDRADTIELIRAQLELYTEQTNQAMHAFEEAARIAEEAGVEEEELYQILEEVAAEDEAEGD